jgi:hypothetical protein
VRENKGMECSEKYCETYPDEQVGDVNIAGSMKKAVEFMKK